MKSLIFKLFTFLVVSSLILSCASESNKQVKMGSSKRPTQAITYPEMAVMFKEYDNGL